MAEVGVEELQARFSSLLQVARGGEDVFIMEEGEPVARLTPLPQTPPPSCPGLQGQALVDHVAAIRARFAGDAPAMTDEEFQAEMDAIRGRD